jgi:purine-binding chemotaxis protein CheW
MRSAQAKTKAAVKAEPEVQRQIVAFRVGEETFGLEIGEVLEVVEYREITPVPRSPAFVAGIINLRGAILPVVDLRRRFGLEGTEPGPETVILVVEAEGRRVGLLADRILDIVKVGRGQALRGREKKSPVEEGFVREILKVEDQALILLAIEALIVAE